MKNQYLGDVSDFRKYALLRSLAQQGRLRIGVCWMLTPDDERPDGRKLAYLDQPERWRELDPPLFDLLRQVVDAPERRRLALVETSGLLPHALFYDVTVPDREEARQAWFTGAQSALRAADLVFFDPDNGVEVASKPKGRKDSSKYVYRDEVEATYAAGHSVLVYQHFTRERREVRLERLTRELAAVASGAAIWSFETAHVAFLLLAQPRHTTLVAADTVLEQAHRVAHMFRAVTLLRAPPA